MCSRKPVRPILLGEVLFDYFPNGEKHLEGSPFNVARHLTGFGENPLLISCIGKDNDGEKILETMHTWNIDSSNIQMHDSASTGRVDVYIDTNGNIDYHIAKNQAFDFITNPFDTTSAKIFKETKHSLLYHGSLILRNSEIKQHLSKMQTQLESDTFIDINLRKTSPKLETLFHFFNSKIHNSQSIKMNLDEWNQWINLLIPDKLSTTKQFELSQFNLLGRQYLKLHLFKELIITLGSKGIVLLEL